MGRRWRWVLLGILAAQLAQGCVLPEETAVSRDARAVRSVTWSVRERGAWSIEDAEGLARELGFATETVDNVLLALDDPREMLRFSPRDGTITVTLTHIEARPIPLGVPASAIARELRVAYEDDANATLHAFEERFGWARQGEGGWSHATYRPRINASRSAATLPP